MQLENFVETSAAAPISTEIGPAAIREQMDRMLACSLFQRSPRLSRFLQFTVDSTLEGKEDQLKEYNIGVAVFGRPESFDPRLDSIVRVEARRLRSKIREYYASANPGELLISYQCGSYVPRFYESAAMKCRRVLVATSDGADGWTQELQESGYHCVGSVSSWETVSALITAEQPDVVLLDLDLAGRDGAGMLPTTLAGRTPVVAIASSFENGAVEQLLRLQPASYLLRSRRPGELRASVELACSRQKPTNRPFQLPVAV